MTTTDDDDNTLLVLRHNLAFDEEVDLRELMNLFEEHQTIMPFNALIDRFSDGLEALLDASSLEVGEVANVVSFMKEKRLYPDKVCIDRIFTKALSRLKNIPEGEDKLRFNAVCMDIKNMLRWVFMH